MGGAFTAGASAKADKSDAYAEGIRFDNSFEDAQIIVETEVLGGADIAPQDIWSQSLRYNSTWAVIDRTDPISVWDLIKHDKGLSDTAQRLASIFEEVWVRHVFRKAVEDSHPLFYAYLTDHPDITTSAMLDAAVKKLSQPQIAKQQLKAEPEFNIVVVAGKSGSAQHPKAIAESTRKGLKLIGGGATVDYGQGPGILLVGSYPDGKSWVAKAKDHVYANAGTVTAYAIYLDDPDDLWEVAMVVSDKSARSNRPEATAKLPEGFALTGGGALVEWDGHGILLTECCPQAVGGEFTAWRAKGKDTWRRMAVPQRRGCSGVRARNGAITTPSTISTYIDQGSLPTLEHGGTPSWGGHCGRGCRCDPRSRGRSAHPVGPSSDHQKWNAQAKDHGKRDGGLELTMRVITRTGRLTKA